MSWRARWRWWRCGRTRTAGGLSTTPRVTACPMVLTRAGALLVRPPPFLASAHHLPDAQRLPVEPAARALPRRQLGASHVPPLGARRRVRADLGGARQAQRGAGRGGLGVAIGRWHAGQGAAGGDLIGPNPTDRGKRGVKRSLLVEADGGPLGLAIAGANVHDTKLLAATLDAIVVARPPPTPERPQHLCLDKGYDNPTGHAAVEAQGYLGHIRRIGEERLDPTSGEKRFPARRWVVERALAWLSK